MPETWSPSFPFMADAVSEQVGEDIAMEFENYEQFADEVCAVIDANAARLDELLNAAWATFVAETGLTREFETQEEHNA